MSKVLLYEGADFHIRNQAAIDIARRRDTRSLAALVTVMADEELVDVSGEEFGRSIAFLFDHGIVGFRNFDHRPCGRVAFSACGAEIGQVFFKTDM